ncbi:MAG: LysM peptidoglycan-binding domain-containing protein [Planctomycetota bacterium]|nr:LysM peptidoglycan-binding domain-containing protein [Planctomycetota bacterium]
MRTETKIGVAVGIFVAVLAVIYFVLNSGPKLPSTDQEQASRNAARDEEQNLPEFETAAPSTAEEPVPVIPRVSEIAEPSDVDSTPAPEHGPIIPPLTPPGGRVTAPKITPASTDAGEDAPIIPRIRPSELKPPAVEKTYVVKKGDAGFWGVAKKVYGNGKHWRLIEKANPNAVSGLLRPGQKLIIPPLPEKTRPAGLAGSVKPVGTAGREQRIYTVQKGDAGFWGIATKVYGDGKHWRLIENANPNAVSRSLRPGQKLIIPPLADRPVAVSRPVALVAKQRTYVVQADDSGLWDIAVKVYGDGNHWGLIEKANPSTVSGRLRVGQKLVIPPLPGASDIRSERTGRATRAQPSDGRPILDLD